MLVLHGVWDGDALAVWGEAESPAAIPPGAHTGAHPFALTAGVLRAALSGAGVRGRPGQLTLTLPGDPTGPVHSSLAPRDTGPAGAHPWTVPAVRLSPAEATEFLSAPAPEGTAHGPGTRHLRAVLDFAEHLVGTGCVLPDLVGRPPRARWRPAPVEQAERHLSALTAALPAAARAHLWEADADTVARRCVLAPVELLTDAVARRRASTPARPDPERTSSPEAVLSRALTGPDPRVDQGSADRLRGPLRRWRSRVQGAGRAELLFLLREPEGEGPQVWSVEFWVRSAADPGLRLPLEQVWSGEGAAWLPDDVGTTATADLRAAARHYPALRQVADQAAPTHLSLRTEGAETFVARYAPLLSGAGFGVVLPEWAGRQALGLRMTVSDGQGKRRGGGVGPTDLVAVSFEALLGADGGGEPLDQAELAELSELARLKRSLVRVRGRWCEMDPEQVEGALAAMRKRGRMRREQALRVAVGVEQTPVPVADVVADGPLGRLLDGGARAELQPMGSPRGFEGKLRPYQDRGASWLRFMGELGLGAVLADDMGLGKTVQLLAVLTDERAEGAAAGPTLLVCPVSLVGNWRREAERFAPGLRVHVQHGPDRPSGNALARLVGACDLVVTTYGVVARDSEELAALPWHRVVCDEAQALKNHDTGQARAVRSLPAETRIALTGTPVENNLGELWSVMDFANPGLLGSAADFRRAVGDRAEAEQGEGENTDLVRRLTGPFVLRRLKTDRSIISDLPDKHLVQTWCTLTPEQASLYKAVVDEMARRLDEADEHERKGLVLTTMARLKAICNHPAQFLGDGSALVGRSGKVERLEGVLGEVVAQGDKALCFTQYARFGERLAPYLRSRLGVPVLWLHGGTPRSEREAMVERFQNSEGPAVFVLSLKAAGTGLNLTAANHVVHVDRWWNPAVENQATDRAFRIGQRRDVQVRTMVCVGTVEERVEEMMARKSALAEGAVATGEERLAGLSVEELREVVRLAPEAVAG
ncbi:DEAD/DEAH box helicase [Nocardiopsis sp. HNM0947]|uniref:DEAD/DEAH box helicase n=1 Tax=Nocardiopsis coralli TaxID=2772213 RepID=A0ABR9P0Z2_9ACTN|nr:DEAD/DEAH box helicase [Nocardiopsis coralli]MBE2997498.1 DEAD/DEAH box helicase [Nocardiopsis coralli]